MKPRRPTRAERLRFIAGLTAADRSEDPARVLTIVYYWRALSMRGNSSLWRYPRKTKRLALRSRRRERKRLWELLSSQAFADAARVIRADSENAEVAAHRVDALLCRLDGLAMLERYDANLRALDAARRRPGRRFDLLWLYIGKVGERGGSSTRNLRVGNAAREILQFLPADAPKPNKLIADLLSVAGIQADPHSVSKIRLREKTRNKTDL